MSEEQIRAIVIQEIKCFFEQLSKNLETVSKDVATVSTDVIQLKQGSKETHDGIARIERLLKGDKDYEDEGMAFQIRVAYEYARKNTEIELAKRGTLAIEHFERWEKQGLWAMLMDMVDKYKILKWFVLFTGIGTLSGVVNIVIMLLQIANK